jgi:hypothetical protein
MSNDNFRLIDTLSVRTGKGFAEGLYAEVNMHIQLFDEFGNLKDERFTHNTVTTAGKNDIAQQMLAAPGAAKYGWMAIGTGTPTSTLLGAEIARVAFDSKTASTNVVTTPATFPAGTGTGAITEAGTFNVVTANSPDMWTSASFSVINKGAADSLVITWTLTFS